MSRPQVQTVDQLFDYFGYDKSSFDALNSIGGPDFKALAAQGSDWTRQGCELARAMLATDEGAAFMAWLKRNVCDPPAYHPIDDTLGALRSMEQIAAAGLYRDGQKHVVHLIYQLADMAAQFEDTAHDPQE
jgi:hypothetical protein